MTHTAQALCKKPRRTPRKSQVCCETWTVPKNVYFLIIFEEEKIDNQEPTTESSSLDSVEHVETALSPAIRKPIEEDSMIITTDFTEINAASYEHSQGPAKTEKGSTEEGFCCVMSMNEGVVL